MVKSYRLETDRLVPAEFDQSHLLVYFDPDEGERKFLSSNLLLDEHTLNSSLDPDELSRLEFEPEHIAIIMKRPKKYSAEDTFLFRVMSMGIFLFSDKIVIIASEEFPLFDDKRLTKIRSLRDIFLKLVNRSIVHFTEHLKVVNKVSDELETHINKSMENRYLHYMFALEKSLVYYLNGINANSNLLQKLKNYDVRLGFDQEEKEFLDDLIIENSQCYKQAEIYSSILGGMMDARASIVSNNLNIMMKRLAVLTVVVGAMNIPASMGGMSEFSRFVIDGYHITWWAAQLAFVIILVVTGWVSYKFLEIFKFFSTEEPDRKSWWYRWSTLGSGRDGEGGLMRRIAFWLFAGLLGVVGFALLRHWHTIH